MFVYPADGTTELSWLSYVNNMNCAVVVQSPTTVTARFTSFATELYVPGVPTVNTACALISFRCVCRVMGSVCDRRSC